MERSSARTPKALHPPPPTPSFSHLLSGISAHCSVWMQLITPSLSRGSHSSWLKTQFKHQSGRQMSTLPQPQSWLGPAQAPPLPSWQGLYGRRSQVHADTQELQRECRLARAMEIQSLGLLEQEKQIGGGYSKEYLPQHMLKNLLETSALQAGNFTEHPGGRHVPGGAGTTWLGGQRDSRRDMGRRKGRPSQHLSSAAWKGQASSCHDQKLDRTCP